MKTYWVLPGFLGDESHYGDALEALPNVLMLSPLRYAGAPDLRAAARALSQDAVASGERPHLIGYSMGARLALLAASLAPGTFASVHAISAHPGFAREDQRIERVEEDKMWARLLLEDWNHFWQLWNKRGSLANTPVPERATPSREEREAWAKVLVGWSTGNQGFLPEVLKDTPAPIQLIIGENDRSFVDHTRTFPCSLKRVFIPNAGHRVPLEAPAPLAEAIRRFAEENP